MKYISVSVQNRISALSAKCYNRALELCNENRISDAITSLEESILLDKKNINARNLLGLCCCRLGRITEAVIQWKISSEMKITDNGAIDYLIDIENDPNTKKLYESVHNYNEAIVYARDGNTDMAIMCLKKAVDINKSFTSACDLLALCYIDRGNNSDAYALLSRALKTDSSDKTALRLMEEIKQGRNAFFKPRQKEEWDNTGSTIRTVKTVSEGRGNILYFVLGVAAAAVITGSLAVPAVIRHYRNEYDGLETQYNIMQNNKNNVIAQNEETIQRLTEENEDLKSRLYTTGSQELQQRVKALSDIKAYYEEGNAETAADKLIALNTAGFGAEVMKEYNALCTTVLPAAAQKYYTSGTEALSQDKDAAARLFEKCVRCTDNGDEIRYSAMYQLGKLAAEKGENDKAVNYFNTVAEKHPVDSVKKEAAQLAESIKNNG